MSWENASSQKHPAGPNMEPSLSPEPHLGKMQANNVLLMALSPKVLLSKCPSSLIGGRAQGNGWQSWRSQGLLLLQ